MKKILILQAVMFGMIAKVYAADASAEGITKGMGGQLKIINNFVNGDLKTYVLGIVGAAALIIAIIQLVRRGFGAQVGWSQIIVEFSVFFVCGLLVS